MTTRERRADRGRREAVEQLRAVGRELRDARLAADLSQARVADASGVSHAEVSRIERAVAANVPLTRLGSIASVVGLRLNVRLYPCGLPLRDAGQLALLSRLRARLHPDLTWTLEAPVGPLGDQRAWDASIGGRGWVAYVDAETRIRDVQALVRRTALKRRDTPTDRVILLLADTRSNRSAVRVVGMPLVAGALEASVVLAALARGDDPAGSAVVFL